MASSSITPLLLSLAVCLSAAGAGNPGFVVRLTQKGLDYARQEGMGVLQQELAKIHLPDFTGYAHTPVGKVKYSFYSMTIRKFQLPSSQISPIPNVGLKLSISGAYIEITGRWRVKKTWIFSTSGGFDLKVQGISISVGLRVGSDEAGRPTIGLSDCSSHISDVSIHVSGALSWMVDLFRHNVENSLRKAIENQICPLVSNAITSKLQPVLQTLPVTAKIDNVAAIDYSLTGPPPVIADYVDVQLKGEFFALSHHTPPPFSPPTLALPDDHNLMVYFGVSDYLFNTAGFVYFSAGKLVFDVTDSMIPKDFNVRLNTTSFGTLIPQLSKMYPDMLMKLQISSTSAPMLDIKPGNLTLSPKLDIQAYVILPNSSLAPAFLLNLTTTALAKVAVNAGRIVGNLELSRVHMDLKHSDVGPFSVTLLNVAVNYYLSSVLLPQVNERLNKGFPLPLLDKVQLSDVVLRPQQDFLLFGANIHYGKTVNGTWL
ncbi:bactericidal permeability-increasing protein-like [Hyla sarda]|uniref:bactericidal permeability-increasing protein-like n=1 Tax=Hyla sarda TaxID=327740 RepID=UPI0024C29157|nr:bactericidal permeability-increasing protein-like [Hyla sarda]XP_056406432.1 bactericidal permeability-increasing protein-like [Hyla sarda]XP_056406433.1 bactericidal permeability-increasing protein-like [Hyla sarda]XP_056406434.1 bactericidal permeability-increasing protein-like [Hyla sarda]